MYSQVINLLQPHEDLNKIEAKIKTHHLIIKSPSPNQVRILALLEQFIGPSIVLLKKSTKFIKLEPVHRGRASEASGFSFH